ncbi:hypothetical protein Tco_0027473 [Tanacetum coccineum]
MLEDLKYIISVEKEVDDLEMEIDDLKSQLENAKIDFSKIDNLLQQEYLQKDILCVTYLSMLDYDNYCDMACKYLDKIKECGHLNLKCRALNAKVVYVTCGKCVFTSNHDACVSMFINDVNARIKKPKVVPIRTRKPTKNANQSVATPHLKTFASETTIQIQELL